MPSQVPMIVMSEAQLNEIGAMVKKIPFEFAAPIWNALASVAENCKMDDVLASYTFKGTEPEALPVPPIPRKPRK